jgi:hypothetical protein
VVAYGPVWNQLEGGLANGFVSRSGVIIRPCDHGQEGREYPIRSDLCWPRAHVAHHSLRRTVGRGGFSSMDRWLIDWKGNGIGTLSRCLLFSGVLAVDGAQRKFFFFLFGPLKKV